MTSRKENPCPTCQGRGSVKHVFTTLSGKTVTKNKRTKCPDCKGTGEAEEGQP